MPSCPGALAYVPPLPGAGRRPGVCDGRGGQGVRGPGTKAAQSPRAVKSAVLLFSLAVLLAAPTLLAQCQTHSGLTYATYQDGDGQTLPLKLELLVPSSAVPVPVVIWIHGGGWFNGSRLPIPSGVSALCSKGYAVASIDYRLTGTAIWPAQI